MVCARHNRNGTIACLNSWGCDNVPYMSAKSDSFARAFFMDVVLHKVYVQDGKHVVEGMVPAVAAEWAYVRPPSMV